MNRFNSLKHFNTHNSNQKNKKAEKDIELIPFS